MKMIRKPAALFSLLGLAGLSLLAAGAASAQVQEYGDEDQEGVGSYSGGFNPVGFDPKAGATLSGLHAGQVTSGAQSGGHSQFFPTAPAGEFAGTDTIHVGSTFTTLAHDGYSYQVLTNPGHGVVGPDTFSLDYSALVPTANTVKTLTLGILLDDFQYSKFGQPFTATVNGIENTDIESVLNGVVLTDPSTKFFTFGIDPSLLTSDKTLKLSIDEGGDGGDGYAVDFLTVGVTSGVTSDAVPEASTTLSFGLLLALGLGGFLVTARKRRAAAAL